MAATGPVVMVGDVLRLERVGGGSGWLLGLGGDAPAKGSRHGSLAPSRPRSLPSPLCALRRNGGVTELVLRHHARGAARNRFAYEDEFCNP